MSPTTWYGFLITMIALVGFGFMVSYVVAQVRHAARPLPIPVQARYRRTPPR